MKTSLFMFFALIVFSVVGSAQTSSQILSKNAQIQSLMLTNENCAAELLTVKSFFQDFKPVSLNANETPGLLRSMFTARVSLHDQLSHLSEKCAATMRGVFRVMREAEDSIGVHGYRDTQLNAADLKFNHQPVPLIEYKKYRPYQLNVRTFQFQKGDIMITKGVSMISSTISGLPKEPSLFSHIAFVYQNDETGAFGTIESYIGVGVRLYTMNEALLNENARILVLRPKDQALALASHDYMYNRVKTSIEKNQYIHYDYKQNFSDNVTLSCEEIAYDAFLQGSRGQMKIPYSQSVVDLKDEKFLNSAGLVRGENMLPADMEVDPRFEIVLDWTDYRIMRDSARKDAIMRESLRWINEKNYVMYNTFQAVLGKILWGTREIDFLWPMSSKLMGVPIDYEKDVPGSGVAMMANLRVLGAYLLPALAKQDQNFFSENNRWMSMMELRSAVDNLRADDEDHYIQNRSSKFHYFFRNPKTVQKPNN
tara:strand:- start:5289 stop:6731 length:1443 start_codon:yes stop_codon:yes gene_type:complete